MTQENVNPFKTPAFSMMILAIGAMIVLTLVMWKKPVAENYACPGGHVDLKGHGMILESVVDGQVMRLTMQKKDGLSETVTLDLCTGKTLGTLTIESDPAILDD